MLVYEKVYEVVKEECRKQFIKGDIKGVSAAFVAEKLSMQRANVARAFTQLLQMNMLQRSNGRPVMYYVDSSIIAYELKALKESQNISSNLDSFLINRSKKLGYKGFYKEEIKSKLIDEMEEYITSYFESIESSQNLEKSRGNMGEVDYIIGVDGGGTKTEAIAYSLQGEEIAHGYAGFGNIVMNQDEGLKNIEIAILQCMKFLGASRCLHIYAGLAGVYTGNNKEIVEKYLQNRFPVSITVISDADLALYALLKGEDGILTIAGTGSISYGIHNGKYTRAGGWGNLLGDEGSGYYMAIQALKRIVWERDAGVAPSHLSREIMNTINVTTIADTVNFVYSSNKSDISALVPVIVKASNDGDASATAILEQAGLDLAENTLKVYNLLKFGTPVKVALRGSVLTKIPLIKQVFMESVTAKLHQVQFIQEEVSPALGAYYIHSKVTGT